jgi:hypothetical protein
MDLTITAESNAPAALILSPAGALHLGPHQSATVQATFTPPAGSNEVYRSVYDLAYCSSGCSDQVTLSGAATVTCLSVAPDSLDFGFVPGERGVTISNACDQGYSLGGSPIITSVDSSGAFRLATGDPGGASEIAGGGQLWVGVVFVPTNSQEYDGLLTLPFADPGEREFGVTLKGFGGGGPVASCTPLQIGFGPNAVGIPSSQLIRCANVGADVYGHPETELFILPHSDNPSFSACALDPETGVCIGPDAGGIRPGEAAYLDVTYTPSDPGSEGANLTLFTDGPDPQPVAVLTGSAESLGPCDSQISTLTLQFGQVPVGQAAFLSFTIANQGQVDCLVDGLRVAPDLLAAEDGGTSPFSLASPSTWYRIGPGKEVTVSIGFAPTAASPSGPYFSGQVDFSLSNPSESSWEVALTGSSE